MIKNKNLIFYMFFMFLSPNLFGFQIFSKAKEEVKVNIGISEKNLNELCNILNKLLSNEFLLYTKTLKCHWNVVGNFFSMHAFFKDLYEQLFKIYDDVAERVRALGGNSFGTMTEFLKNAALKEHPGTYPDEKTMIKNLLEDHEAIIRQLRDDTETSLKLGDVGTNTFLADLIIKHEKMAWMLRAHLTK